jgi:biopolymer transport protein TolR
MLRPRLNPDRRICRVDFSAYVAMLAALLTLFIWSIPIGFSFHCGRRIDLPMASHPVLMSGAEREDALLIAISRDGHVSLGNQRVPPEELIADLRDRVHAGAPRKVYIKSDARVHYRSVKGVLDSVHSAGLTDVAFITDPRRTGEP